MFKKTVFVLLGIFTVIYLAGCGKKQKSLEEMQEPMSMEALSTLSAEKKNVSETPAASAVKEPQPKPISAPSPALEPLPPSGPFKPTAIQIQTALKNAGYYTGSIDGKIGPKSKRAIEEFQKAHGLVADGKVGPKTWAALSAYLNAPATTASTQ